MGVTLGVKGSKCPSSIFYTSEKFFGYGVEEGKIKKNGVRVEESDVYIFRIGSNQFSPSF